MTQRVGNQTGQTHNPAQNPALVRPWGSAGQPDPFDPDQALTAAEPLLRYNRAGLLTSADVHAARRLAVHAGEQRPEPILALAFALQALRQGSVCLDLSTLEVTLPGERALEPGQLLAAVRQSPLIAVGEDAPARPGRLIDTHLYLERYHRQEIAVARALDERSTGSAVTGLDEARADAALARLFPADTEQRQRLATLLALRQQLLVIAGGPGTGKTTLVAKLLAVLADQPGPTPRIALAAPTGKAAARLSTAIAEQVATLPVGDRAALTGLRARTLHALLGGRPGKAFSRNENHPLTEDILVVDETSMVSLSTIAALFAALTPSTRLVLVGDPDQLASVEAGAVLADLVARAENRPQPEPQRLTEITALAERAQLPNPDQGTTRLAAQAVVRLRHRFRFGGQIADLADAIVGNEPEQALRVLRQPAAHAGGLVELIDLTPSARPTAGDAAAGSGGSAGLIEGTEGTERGSGVDPADRLRAALAAGRLDPIRDQVLDSARRLTAAAREGRASQALEALAAHQLLTAHRRGPFGASWWSNQVERWVREALPGYATDGPWYLGRPVMMTSNDPELSLFNGDTGVVVHEQGRGLVVAFGTAEQPRTISVARLPRVETVHALTIHKSQGSQYAAVSLVLPPSSSPLLTRELLYTAITRASDHVRIIGDAASVATAIARPVRRASGLSRLPDQTS